MFRKLTLEEEEKFRQWARENYKPFSPINGVWHPATQKECTKINEENSVTIITHNGIFQGNPEHLKLFGNTKLEP